MHALAGVCGRVYVRVHVCMCVGVCVRNVVGTGGHVHVGGCVGVCVREHGCGRRACVWVSKIE